MAMDHAKEIMRMELNADHKNFARLLSAKQSVLASVFTATARVRDGLLRPSSDDGLDDILARIKGAVVAEDLGTGVGVEAGQVLPDALLLRGGDLGSADEVLVTADDLFN